MRKVFSSADDVIHVFAQRTQSEGKSSNVFFYGDKIYSYGYHYELARFIDADNIYINDKGYSNTTAKHISSVRYATRQYTQWFATQCDLDLVYSQIISAKDSLMNARKPEKYISIISSLWESLNKYLEFSHKLSGVTKKNSNQYNSDKYKELKAIVAKVSSPDSLQALKDYQKKQEQARKKREQAQVKQLIKKFTNYEINTFRVGDEDYLRLSKDNKYVETSQGVAVSISGAKMLYTAIKNKVDIVGRHIDSYTVKSINGVLTIGCHRINMGSVKQVGEQLLTNN